MLLRLLPMAAAVLLAAENPFIGTWKLDQAASKFAGDTVHIEKAGSGMLRYRAAGLSYTFRLDNREYPGLLGYSVQWKQLDARTWETANRLQGKLISTDTTQLSADGKTLNVTTRGVRPNGEAFEDVGVYRRTAGGSGLIGSWMSTKYNISPVLLRFDPSPGDGIAFSNVSFQATCKAKADGKDYRMTGPTVPPEMTVAWKRAGARRLEIVQKDKGKPIFSGAFTVSPDSATLTYTGGPVAVKEPFTAVYRRQ